MKVPSRRTRRWAGLAAGPLAVLLAGGLVWQASQAAFTATTRNAGNSWSTGQVTLTDDDNGVAGFHVTNLKPGDTGEQCITVTSNSNVPGEVRAYVENLATSKGLENHITLTIERGTGGGFGDCTGFVAADAGEAPRTLRVLADNFNSYENGGLPWAITGNAPESSTYRGTWVFDTTGLDQSQVNALQGAQVSIDLVWELQSTTP